MKVLKVIKSIIVGILGFIFFTFALVMTILLLNYNDFGITQFGDTNLVIIRDSIANDQYKKGDLVLVKTTKLEDIQLGDYIFAYKIDSKGVATIDLGVVGQIYPDDNAISFENGSGYSMDYVVGKSTTIYNDIGTFLSIVESRWGFLFIVLVPGFLIFIYEIYALIVEIKYGDEE